MAVQEDHIADIRPEVTQMARGGWLAVSPKWAPLRIGVVAATKPLAAEAFQAALARWTEVLAR